MRGGSLSTVRSQLPCLVAMQIMGFGWMFVLFLLCAWQYQRLTQPSHLWIFRALYYLSRSALHQQCTLSWVALPCW
jgi:hypothetical protein